MNPGPTKKSKYWHHFKRYNLQVHPDKKYVARCNICTKEIRYENGVTGLKSHIKNKHIEIWNEMNPIAESAPAQAESRPQNTITKHFKTTAQRKQELLELAVRWVIETSQPLTAVEKESFRQMIQNLTMNLNRPLVLTRVNVRDKIMYYGRIAREAVRRELADKHFSVLTDHWTTGSNVNYAALTGHYAEEGSLKRVCIDFGVYNGTSSGEEISSDFMNRFEQAGLPTSNIVACTTDTAGSMLRFGDILQESYGIPHLLCVDHNLHLNAKLAFDDENLPGSENAMHAARNLCEHFSQSTQAADKLRMIQEHHEDYKDKNAVKMIQDVTTRWWSTYGMLVRLHYLRDAINTLVTMRSVAVTPLTETQVAALDAAERALAVIAHARRHLEDDQYPTLSMVPLLLRGIKCDFENLVEDLTQPDAVGCLATTMLSDLTEKRYITLDSRMFYEEYERGHMNRPLTLHTLVLLATALDPRTKNLRSIPEGDHDSIWNLLATKMKDIDEDNLEPTLPTQPPDSINDGTNAAATATGPSTPQRTSVGRLVQNCASSPVGFALSGDDRDRVIANEIEGYKREEQLVFDESNYKEKAFQVMPWWEGRKHKFPRLYELAQRILPIPASEAPSKRLFSLASRVLTKTRSRLDSNVVSAIIMIQENRPLLDKWYNRITGDDPSVLPDLVDEELDEAVAIYADSE